MELDNELKTLGWPDEMIDLFNKVAEKVRGGAIWGGCEARRWRPIICRFCRNQREQREFGRLGLHLSPQVGIPYILVAIVFSSFLPLQIQHRKRVRAAKD